MKFVVFFLFSLMAPLTHAAAVWFEDNTSLTAAHRYLLNDELEKSFYSMIEVWQQDTNNLLLTEHLSKLLDQALTKDCGRSLSSETLPNWLSSVLIRRHVVQNSGRRVFKLLVDVDSVDSEIKSISVTKWLDKSLTSDTELIKPKSVETEEKKYQKIYNLLNPLESGLYRITIKNKDDLSWSSWVILNKPRPKQVVRWSAKGQWLVEKNGSLNPYCPLPVLDVSLYNYVDGIHTKIWERSFESDYPQSLDSSELLEDRYVLTISLKHRRWQGAITIEDQQVISKAYDVSEN